MNWLILKPEEPGQVTPQVGRACFKLSQLRVGLTQCVGNILRLVELLIHITEGLQGLGFSPATIAALAGSLKQSVISAPLPLYLRIEDRNSMAHSVEARVPFLDYRLVSFVCGLSDDWKVRGPWNKYVLREGMRGRIPESVRGRVDKMGFPTASKKWFAHDLYEPLRDILVSRAVRDRGIYNANVLVADLDRHRRGEVDVANRLFHVAEFEILSDLLRQDAGSAS